MEIFHFFWSINRSLINILQTLMPERSLIHNLEQLINLVEKACVKWNFVTVHEIKLLSQSFICSCTSLSAPSKVQRLNSSNLKKIENAGDINRSGSISWKRNGVTVSGQCPFIYKSKHNGPNSLDFFSITNLLICCMEQDWACCGNSTGQVQAWLILPTI